VVALLPALLLGRQGLVGQQRYQRCPSGWRWTRPAGLDRFHPWPVPPRRHVLLGEDAGDSRLILNPPAMAPLARGQRLGNGADAAFGIVDAAVMAIAKHHPGINQRRLGGGHHGPAVAFHIDEPQQFGIAQMRRARRPTLAGRWRAKPRQARGCCQNTRAT
jgi:hypothetical protein